MIQYVHASKTNQKILMIKLQKHIFEFIRIDFDPIKPNLNKTTVPT